MSRSEEKTSFKSIPNGFSTITLVWSLLKILKNLPVNIDPSSTILIKWAPPSILTRGGSSYPRPLSLISYDDILCVPESTTASISASLKSLAELVPEVGKSTKISGTVL